jgi:putative acetyltransferase
VIAVEIADPRAPAATALLKASHALMGRLFPSDACHFLSIDDLCVPEVHFVTARRGDAVLGCGAVAQKAGYGELKSIYVDEGSRGQGIADAILRALEDHARSEGMTMLKLETGTGLDAAHRLYARHGFKVCGPFGDYVDHMYSVYMEKAL